jgi:predicted phage terminase large subunit-like protein
MQNSLKSSAAAQLLQRRKARADFQEWARLNGFVPALHHRRICDELTEVTQGRKDRLMLLLPPGSAKSTYTSVLFPPWYLATHPGRSILACSYSATLAVRFGKRCRNLITTNEKVLGYGLASHSQAADDWETTTGGIYFCAGVGAGIAGHRADLGLIDDPLGSQEDADSKTMREKQWDWYLQDFVPRLKPGAARVIIANRRHEDDLIGRILAQEGDAWTVVRLPMVAEADDALGRQPGELLWPEWFTPAMATEAKRVPRVWAGLYQQRPAPEEGDYFKRDMLVPYKQDDLPKNLRYYVASDFAVTEAAGDRTCMLPVGVDEAGTIWILPDVWWKSTNSQTMITALAEMMKRRQPMVWWAEKGQISKSLGPFIKQELLKRSAWGYITEVTPTKAKDVRARSIQGMMGMGLVRFPTFAAWWPEAEHELLTFPGGTHDDFVDALAYIGLGLSSIVRATAPEKQPEERTRPMTYGDIKRNVQMQERLTQALYGDR